MTKVCIQYHLNIVQWTAEIATFYLSHVTDLDLHEGLPNFGLRTRCCGLQTTVCHSGSVHFASLRDLSHITVC